jgi:hypothetical protein
MGDVARAGRTIVLVSHQLGQIRRLCYRAVWVDEGRVRQVGTTHDVVSAYQLAMSTREPATSTAKSGLQGKARFVGWEVSDGRGPTRQSVNAVGPVGITFYLDVDERITRGHHGIALFNTERQLIWGQGSDGLVLEPGRHELTYQFPVLPLKPGPYSWLVSIFEDQTEIDLWDAVPEMIVATELIQHGKDEWTGLISLPNEMSVRQSERIVAR